MATYKGFMSNCFFSGGAYGVYGGNQQYTVTGFEFVLQSKAAICLIWDWGWTWSHLFVADTPIGILLINPEDTSGPQAGSTYIMDSLFDGVGVVVHASAIPPTVLGSSIITLDNIAVASVDTMVTFADGSTLEIPVEATQFVIVGNVAANGCVFLFLFSS